MIRKAWLPVVLLILAVPARADQRQQAVAVVAASLENYRKATRAFSCTARLRYGMAASLEEAWTRGPTTVQEEAQLRWLKRDRWQLLDVAAKKPLELQMRGPSSGSWYVFGDEVQLMSREYALWRMRSRLAPSAGVRKGPRQDHHYWTPWNLAGLDGGEEGVVAVSILPEITHPRCEVKYDPRDQRLGRPLRTVTLTMHPPQGESWIFEASFDPQAGFLCVAAHFQKPGSSPYRLFRVTKTKKLPGGSWWPVRAVQVDVGERTKRVSVIECVVTRLIPHPPTEDRFRISLAKGTLLGHEKAKGPYYVLPETQKIHITQLPEIYQRVVAAARDESPGAEPARGWPWWGWALVGLAGATGGCWLYRRFARRAG